MRAFRAPCFADLKERSVIILSYQAEEAKNYLGKFQRSTQKLLI